jgi:hypothetical protein
MEIDMSPRTSPFAIRAAAAAAKHPCRVLCGELSGREARSVRLTALAGAVMLMLAGQGNAAVTGKNCGNLSKVNSVHSDVSQTGTSLSRSSIASLPTVLP